MITNLFHLRLSTVFDLNLMQYFSPVELKMINMYEAFRHQLTIKFNQSQNAIALSTDGNTLVTGGADDQKISVWDTNTGKLIRTWMFAPDELLHGLSNTVESVAISTDNKILVSGGRLIQIWNLETGNKIRTLKSRGAICSVISPDMTKLITHGSGRSPTTIIWDLHKGRKIYQRTGQYDCILSFVISPDSKIFIGGNGTTNNVTIWNLNTGSIIKEMENKGDIRVHKLAISPNGETLAGGGYDGIKIWEIATGKQVQTIDKFKNIQFHSHLDFINSLVFSPDENMLFSSGSDGSIQVWNVQTGKNIYTFPSELRFSSIALSFDGQTLVGHAQSNNTVEVWKNSTAIATI
ncbi:WD40 repeat domain-containing protein [Nostoc sp. FACHB-190]|uniref:WD40 repeat domain-containing protein n=1 Tax=Nostoc sp. FACHB-190 TaxID=2692838 RepID=UPI0016888FCF|nr:WD40 repeat domain-containing protein [Nostoc sp. FACHB-190]MBD2301869.1 WD40 repeat domain-containing protein [Nostoc sp. FACHB-190]